MERSVLIKVFLSESEDLVSDLEQGLIAIEGDSRDEETIHRIFRAAHTLKSSAGMLGFEPMVALAHVAESVLARVRSHELAVDKSLIDQLLFAADEFRRMLKDIAERAALSEGAASEQLLAGLRRYLAEPRETSSLPTAPATRPAVPTTTYRIQMSFSPKLFETGQDPGRIVLALAELGHLRETSIDITCPSLFDMNPVVCYSSWTLVLDTTRPREDVEAVFLFVTTGNRIEISTATPPVLGSSGAEEIATERRAPARRAPDVPEEAASEAASRLELLEPKEPDASVARRAVAPPRRAATLRVDAEKLDKVVNLVGELVVGIAQALQTHRDDNASQASRLTAVEALDTIGRSLQAQVMAVRMVPVEETFHRLKRGVRDLANELGKKVVLEAEGSETELDKVVIEQLADPLRHMVRNAIAHGIEAPDVRSAAGKPEVGHVTLRAAQRQGHIVIEVADDGRGIDPAAVLAKARRLGLQDVSDDWSEQQLLSLVFRPGFSTAEKVDEISGRGVGLDVVQRNVQDLRGVVEVQSVVGRGTTFRISLPLTLAIIEGMHVQVGGKVLTLPLLSVVELLSPRPGEIQTVEGKGELIEARGSYLPVVRLGDVLSGVAPAPAASEPVVVVVEHDERRFGVVVDRVIGMDQTVVKPLENAFSLIGAAERGYHKPDAISGATILGDGGVGLILDVRGLERMAFGQDFA